VGVPFAFVRREISGRQELEVLLLEALHFGRKVIADAVASIETQKMAALTDVKNQIGNMVIEVSEKVIRKQLENKADQEKYIQQMAGELHQFGK
jgi:F0F1-type ATP synthase membrane subunit b/b'